MGRVVGSAVAPTIVQPGGSMYLRAHCTLVLTISAALVTGCTAPSTDEPVAARGTTQSLDRLASARVAYAEDGLPFIGERVPRQRRAADPRRSAMSTPRSRMRCPPSRSSLP